jgi:hypothetical protein
VPGITFRPAHDWNTIRDTTPLMYSTQTDIHSKSSIKANDVQARKALSEKGPGNEPIVGELRSIV